MIVNKSIPISSPKLVVDVFVTILKSYHLLDAQNKSIFAFSLEVRSGKATWNIKKRLESFELLYNTLGAKAGGVPSLPRLGSGGCQDHMELRIAFQAWIRRVIRDPRFNGMHDLHVFLERSDSLADAKCHAPQPAKPASAALPDLPVPMDISPSAQGPAPVAQTQQTAAVGGPQAVMGAMAPSDLVDHNVNLSSFLLLKVIGRGSFGKVMLVRKIDSGMIYAMKVLKKENIIKRNQVEHTKTERNVLEYIRHPFIVALRFAFQSKSKLYFVLDYCSGGELFFHLGKAGKFPEELTRFYAAEIVLALEYLHSVGIVYRDLKPENVLLDAEGHIALTDFGLSKEGVSDNVSAHSFCGTPEYLAPEILNRTGHGRAADWWSLGALLYEMLTGMPPFYSRDREKLFLKILRGQLRFPPNISVEARSLLQGLLNRNAQERLGSANDANDVKSHPFFRSVNWEALLNRRVEPPFKPNVMKDEHGVDETNNFDEEFTNLPIQSVDTAGGGGGFSVAPASDRFAGFTFINPASNLDAENDTVASMEMSPRIQPAGQQQMGSGVGLGLGQPGPQPGQLGQTVGQELWLSQSASQQRGPGGEAKRDVMPTYQCCLPT